MLFKEGQIVTGKPDTDGEYHKGMVIESDGRNMLISITAHEFDEDQIGEEVWVEEADYRLVKDLNVGANIPSSSGVYTAPKMDMNQALILGII